MRVYLFGLLFLGSLPSFAQSFKYEDLVTLIETNQLQHLEDVLPLLPDELRSHYSLMRDSRSLQGATDVDPRVIMYGRNARLTCTFNGDSNQRGFDTIECFQFRDATDSFDFRQIQFPTGKNGLTHVEYSESNRSVDKKISCSFCHGADPRPNWDSYSHWPGAYGADDDVLQEDAQRYKGFVANRDAHHPRYQWLIQQDYAQAPYMDGGYFDIDHRPNLRLAEATGRLMGLRDHRMMQQKLGERPTLAFSVSVLQCLFTDEQKAKLKTAKVDLDQELNLASIFSRMQISNREWSTIIFNDPPGSSSAPWDHQFGYTFLKENLAMTTVQDLAKTDPTLADGISKIKEYFAKAYKDPDLRFYQDMNEAVLGLDLFGRGYIENRKYLCPRMAEIFTEKFIQ